MSAAKIKIGIIGMGGIGTQHLLDLLRFPEQVVVEVVCDSDVYKLEKVKNYSSIANLTTDINKFFNFSLDAVVVSTPDFTHYSLVKRALLQGWHVLCEKPFTMNTCEAEELVDLAAEKRVINMIAFSYRFVPVMKMLKSIVEKGVLGKIYHVRCHYLQSWLSSSLVPFNWRLDVGKSDGGVLGDLGAHIFDIAEFITGRKILRVNVFCKTFVPQRRDLTLDAKKQVTVGDGAAILGEMEEGIFFTAEMSRCVTGRGNSLVVEINGEQGRIIVDVEKPREMLACLEPMTNYTYFHSNFANFPCPDFFGSSDYHYAQTEAFVKALQGESLDLPTFECGLRSQKVIDTCLISAKELRWIGVDNHE